MTSAEMVVVGMKHIVCFSGGHSSAIAAVEVVRKFGAEDTILLNHDWFVVYCLYPEIWEKAKLAEDTIGYSILKQGYLSDFEAEFAKLKEKALPPTEKAKPQTFWAAARKLIKDDDDLPCECSF